MTVAVHAANAGNAILGKYRESGDVNVRDPGGRNVRGRNNALAMYSTVLCVHISLYACT